MELRVLNMQGLSLVYIKSYAKFYNSSSPNSRDLRDYVWKKRYKYQIQPENTWKIIDISTNSIFIF